jgi:hypothetical protein
MSYTEIMLSLIIAAIQNSQTLEFTYKGEPRVVEPHTYGGNAKGHDAICAWQETGGSGAGYRLFLVDQMGSVSIGHPFNGPRPNYHRGDRQFVQIYAEL